jgi:aspartyl-tRNA(Asn)/glutamyl-tRNA(Gln) amidotransferase subunit A
MCGDGPVDRRPDPPPAYRPALTRAAMAALAPEADESLLDAAAELLDPLWPSLDPREATEHGPTFDPREATEPGPPALTFDPVLAAGASPPRHEFPEPPQPPAPSVPAAGELHRLSACDIAALVRNGQLSAVEVAREFAGRIETLDGELNAFITVTVDAALSRARSHPTGRLAGVPLGLKDLVDTAGIPTTCGSAVHRDRVPRRDATCWRRLHDEGAVLLGKLNTHEFAAGVTSTNDHFGTVLNPRHRGHIAGGSSGGSAAAVCAGLTAAAIGTDTGGSVRIPASCCGVVGLKPTFGIVPTAGVQPLAWSLDHVGPLARTVRDAGLLLDILAGTACEPAARAGAAAGLAGLRVGVPSGWLADADGDVRTAFSAAVETLARRGAHPVELSDMPSLDQATAVNRIVAYAEASAAHDRILRHAAANYGPAVRPRQEAGRFVLATQYLVAQQLRGGLCRALAARWRQVDVLALPTLPCRVPGRGGVTVSMAGRREPVGSALIRFTGPFNLAGAPAISVPAGPDRDGLPTGLQIVGPPHADALVCFVAAAFEAERPADEIDRVARIRA